ncbi:uncharacterized protein LOC129753328 [Uranotaenia lowii]|uniref:uncharacterized protein LOC129753328 n=1 Tax=Uranotaenia lowii TaxID=190385 RepID=UPI0024792541|nr:uncharacterized protein LOC129753328 [Uranotaenia lowii]
MKPSSGSNPVATPNQLRKGYNCYACSEPDSICDLVQCDRCKRWWHQSCAGVTPSVENRPWSCRLCSPVPSQPTIRAKSTTSEKSSRARKRDLQLQQLDEKRALDRKAREVTLRATLEEIEAEKQHVSERFSVMQAEDSSSEEEEEGDRSILNTTIERSYRTQDWVQSSPTINEVNQQQATNSSAIQTESNHQELPPTPQRITGAFPKRRSMVQHPDLGPSRMNWPNWDSLSLVGMHQWESLLLRKNIFHVQDPKAGPLDRNAVYGSPVIDRTVQDSTSTAKDKSEVQLYQSGPSAPALAPPTSSGYCLPVPEITSRSVLSAPNQETSNRNVEPAFLRPSSKPTVPNPNWAQPIPAMAQRQQVGPRGKQILEEQRSSKAGQPPYQQWPERSTMIPSVVQPSTSGQPVPSSRASNQQRLASTQPPVTTPPPLHQAQELLINALLDKVRSVPAPKADKLATFIDFGIAVQSLCGHLDAANQQDHLSNPSLLNELVNRLPPDYQFKWVEFSEFEERVDLKLFSTFVTKVAKSASRVSVYNGAVKREDKLKPKRGSLNVHSECEERNQVPIEKLCPACFRNQHSLKDCSRFSAISVDERWNLVQRYGACRNCLNFHGKRSCRISGRCGVNGCTHRHHQLLHSGRSKNLTSNPREPGSGSGHQNKPTTRNSANTVVPISQPSTSHTPTHGNNYAHHSPELTFLFRILPITVHGNGKSVETFAFVDEGSSLTMVEDSLVEELGIQGTPQVLCLQWTGDMMRTEQESKIVDIKISGPSKNKMRLSDARTVSNLALSTQSLDYEGLVRNYAHLKGLPVASYKDAVPRILIGVNNLHMTVPLRIKQGRTNEPVAAKTKLGWCIYGGRSSEHTAVQVNYHACSCSQDDSLHKVVREYFEMEDMGIHATTKLESEADMRARRILKESTQKQGDRYETGLLWKYDQFEFPDSYPMAFKRYECLEKKMARNPELRLNLTKQMESYQAKGYAHQITEDEKMNSDPRRVWYLPLGVVVNPKKPGKVRMIWDASATVDGISLNTMLLKGPDELAPLPWVLFRFRQYEFAVTGDIAEMFHQIRINERDRQAQRFLWRPDGSSKPETYVMDVATFGSACSPASAQYVKNRNAQEFKQTSPRAVEGIINGHYVDDYAESFSTVAEAIQIATEIKSIHAAGGFNIRDWRSNSEKVVKALDGNVSSEPKSLKLETTLTAERVLGMHWLPHDDVLGYSTALAPELQEIVSSKRKPTKREALRCLMTFFDPLGLLAAFVLHGKVLLQDIWRAGTQWDEVVGDEEHEKWLRWIEGFPLIDSLQIPRCYFDSVDYDDIQLHIFVDASEDACAAVGYFRVPKITGGTVLAWIRSDHRRYTQFVACRVGEILSNTNIAEWRWVPSKQNVADLATKWGQGPPLTAENAWFRGPDFLQEGEDEWPQPRKPTSTEEELKTSRQVSCLHSGFVAPVAIVDTSRFSKWERMLRTVAYAHRYVNRRLKMYPVEAESSYLSQEELLAAENTLFWIAQQQSYPVEASILRRNLHQNSNGQDHLPKHSELHHISPYFDENFVLRVDSRVGAAKNVAMTVRYPVILPPTHRITELIIDFYHRKFLHANFETVVNELRQSFHISKIRATVKKVIRQCQHCKVYRCKPQVPRMGPLPAARLASFERPFSYVGLDLFGPILVKRGRSSVKRWVALFTCLTIRAVHVEVVHSLTTESCIMSIRRFIVRRGAPLEIHSDNGTNFRGAGNILEQQIGQFQDDLAATFTNTHTKWVFIPPGTPHMGGSWERMVRSVKTAMEKSLCVGRKLDDEGLNTFVVEAEGVVNSRPLTYLPLDSEEAESLTPNHFLLGSSNGVKQPSKQFVDVAVALKSTWNQIECQLDMFWRRWVWEYLPTLTRRTKWFNEVQEIGVGNLVVIVNEAKRNGWVRGRVLEVFPGVDGRVRHAVVQTNRGLSRQSVSRLAVLDVELMGDTDPKAVIGQRHEGEDVDIGNTASVAFDAPLSTRRCEMQFSGERIN